MYVICQTVRNQGRPGLLSSSPSTITLPMTDWYTKLSDSSEQGCLNGFENPNLGLKPLEHVMFDLENINERFSSRWCSWYRDHD